MPTAPMKKPARRKKLMHLNEFLAETGMGVQQQTAETAARDTPAHWDGQPTQATVALAEREPLGSGAAGEPQPSLAVVEPPQSCEPRAHTAMDNAQPQNLEEASEDGWELL